MQQKSGKSKKIISSSMGGPVMPKQMRGTMTDMMKVSKKKKKYGKK